MKTTTYRGLTIFDSDLERQVAQEVLGGRSYPKPPLARGTEIRTIVDIGAHVGLAATWFRTLWPGANITCFEPSPESFRLLSRNCPGLGINAALGDREGDVLLALGEHPVLSSVCPFNDSRPSVKVHCYHAGHALDVSDNPIDLIKLDAEGSEPAIMQSAAPHFAAAKVVYVEFHRWDDRRKIDSWLTREGTHVLYHARIDYSPNRGELAYIRRDAIDPRVLDFLYVPRS